MDLNGVKSEKFYQTEVEPVIALLDSPVSAFVFEKEYDERLAAQTIERGFIPVGAFLECSVFDNSEGSRRIAAQRRRAKTAQEILKVLSSESGTIDDSLNIHHTEQQVYRTIIVEAARVIRNKERAAPLAGNERAKHIRERAIYERALREAQENLFTGPDQETNTLVMRLFNQEIATAKNVMTPAQAEYADEFIATYPWTEVGDDEIEKNASGQEKLDALHSYLHEQYEEIFNGIQNEYQEISNNTLVQMTNEFMKRIGLPMAGDETDTAAWMCVDDTKVKGFQVAPARLRLLSGRRSFEITWKIYKELMVHEVLGHVMRAENGRLSGYGALQTGLPRVNDAEEGIGLTLQKLWSGDTDESLGRDHFRYLAVSYADGNLDGEYHTESETLQFISSFMTITQFSKQKGDLEPDKILRKQRALAYDHVKRAYRGMPQGVILWSNCAYLKGRTDIMRFIARDDRSPAELIQYLQQGKFDPNNEEHVKLMEYVTNKRQTSSDVF